MIEPIRVLQVFGKLDRGGAETMIMNLYRKIDRDKVQFDFIVHTEEEGDFYDEIRSLGGKIHCMPKYTGKNHLYYKKVWITLFENYKEYKIIHGHLRSTASIYLNIANKYELTTIAHSHNTSSGNGISAIAKDILQFRIRYIANYLFACSNAAGYWLYGKRACGKENFFILKNAIDTKKFVYNKTTRDKMRNELQIQEKFVIGHVGRFDRQKNHELLIDIFREISISKENAILLLIGNGELKSTIEKKVADLNLEKCVYFLGTRSDVAEILQAIDVFLFPSLFEGLPVTLIEAQASGVPCVISDSITKDVKVTKNLLTFMPLNQSSQKWAEAVLMYKENNVRNNMQSDIEKSGYDINNTAKWIEEFYLNAYHGHNYGDDYVS